MKKARFVFLILTLAVCIASLTACSRAEQYFVYGTTLTIKADDLKAQKDMKAVADYISSLESVLSPTVEGSDIHKVNAAKAGQAVKCSQVTMDIAKIAKAVYDISEGAYDPSVYPLVRLWKFSGDTFGRIGQEITPPAQDEIDGALSLVGFDKFTLDFDNSTITKSVDGAMLDFGGIAKAMPSTRVYQKRTAKCLSISVATSAQATKRTQSASQIQRDLTESLTRRTMQGFRLQADSAFPQAAIMRDITPQ